MDAERLLSEEQSYREMSFAVPWGVIAAKEWGRDDGKPFLGLHGFLDNANTFDRLARLLPEDIHFICIDFPGHGKSSHRWPGMPYIHFEYIADIKKVISQLKWKKYSIIGHSMGANLAALYAGTFPCEVENLILLDFRGPSTYPVDKAAVVLARYATAMAQVQTTSLHVYPNLESAAKRRQLKAVGGTILTKEDAVLLAKRGTRTTKNGLVFSNDPIIKHLYAPLVAPQDLLLSILSKIQCAVLTLEATDTVFETNKVSWMERINIIRQSAKFKLCKKIKGGHHFHLENPGQVVQEIKGFLTLCQSYDCTLNSKL